MVLRTVLRSLLSPKPQTLRRFFSDESLRRRPPSLANLVSDVSRALSDHRNPQDDLELSLARFSSQVSTSLVEQVLKRCKNLGFSAHRFFLWAKTLPDFHHSAESHHILVDVLGSSKQFAILWDLLTDWRDSDQVEIVEPEIFWIVFRSYSRANLPRDAIRAFNRMVEFRLKPSVHDLDQLLYTLCKRKHVKHAHEFFDKAKNTLEPSVKTYTILIRGYGDVGEPDEARKLFDEMLGRKLTADTPAYNAYLEALCKGEKTSEAYEIFRGMRSKGVNPDACTYSVFIRSYCESNDMHSVFRVLDRMKKYDLLPNAFTYNSIIKKLCKNEKIDEAYQLLDEMIENGVNPDSWSYNAILAFHCDHCEVTRALQLLVRMEKDKLAEPDQHSYNMVLKLLIRIGRFDRMSEVWGDMSEKGFFASVSTYSVMVHGLCKKKGKLEEACKYFETMVDEGIPPYSTTVEMLRNRLLGFGLLQKIEIVACKMERSTCCAIQDLAKVMRGNKAFKGPRREDSDSESD